MSGHDFSRADKTFISLQSRLYRPLKNSVLCLGRVVRRFSAAFKRFILCSRAGFSRRHNPARQSFSAPSSAGDPILVRVPQDQESTSWRLPMIAAEADEVQIVSAMPAFQTQGIPAA